MFKKNNVRSNWSKRGETERLDALHKFAISNSRQAWAKVAKKPLRSQVPLCCPWYKIKHLFTHICFPKQTFENIPVQKSQQRISSREQSHLPPNKKLGKSSTQVGVFLVGDVWQFPKRYPIPPGIAWQSNDTKEPWVCHKKNGANFHQKVYTWYRYSINYIYIYLCIICVLYVFYESYQLYYIHHIHVHLFWGL